MAAHEGTETLQLPGMADQHATESDCHGDHCTGVKNVGNERTELEDSTSTTEDAASEHERLLNERLDVATGDSVSSTHAHLPTAADECSTMTTITPSTLEATEQHRSTAEATFTQTTLLGLPAELRMLIYEALFAPLVQPPPKHFDVYLLPSEWPKFEFDACTSIFSTCKALRAEAKTHFEAFYLSTTVLYFNNAFKLHNFTHRIDHYAQLNPAYHDLRICLSDCSHKAWYFAPHGEKRRTPDKLRTMTEGVTGYINRQPAIDFCLDDRGPICNPWYNRGILQVLHPWRQYPGATFDTHVRQAKNIDVLRVVVPSSDIRASVHQVCGYRKTNYKVITGRVRELDWSFEEWCKVEECDIRESQEFYESMMRSTSTQIEQAGFDDLQGWPP